MPIYLLSLIESEEDRISLSALYEKYKNYLYVIALDMSNDVETADEALSETFVAVISVYERIRDYEPDHMRYYLRAVLKNKTRDIINFKSKTISYHADMNDDIKGLEDIDFDSLGQNILVSAMLQIKEEYREILIFRYVDEMDFFDISSLLNISMENVRKRLSRARIALKNKIEEMEACNEC